MRGIRAAGALFTAGLLASCAPHLSALDNIRARNKELVFTILANAGIHRVTVDYDREPPSATFEAMASASFGSTSMSAACPAPSTVSS